MPNNKTIGWVIGSILVLGGGGYALAKYNTNSMAHVLYQQVTGEQSNQLTSSSLKTETTSKEEKINTDEITKMLKQQNFMGEYAVLKDGKLSENIKVGKNASENKYYQVADLENAVTAAAILKLVDQGKLRLDTPVNQYYSSLSVSSDVTIQSLLGMTSGLGNNSTPTSQLSNVLSWNINNAISIQSETYSYQEINYVLLEGIVAQVADSSYQEYIKKNFLKPNNLEDVKFVSSVDDQQLAPPYNGTTKVSDETLTQEMNSQMGKNQIMATPDGFLKLVQILIKDYGDNTHFVTSSQHFTGQLIKQGDMYYGSGGIVGYRTSVAISTDGQRGIVLMSNDSNGQENLTTLVKDTYKKLK